MDFSNDTGIFTDLVLLVFIAGIIVYLKRYGKTNLPPGPWSLPIVGNLSLLGIKDTKEIYSQFSKFGKKYGPIFSLKVGQQLCIVISNDKALKEAFMKNEFIERLHNQHVLELHSIFNDSGEVWSQHRRFLVRCLQEMNLERNGSDRIEEYIIVQSQELVSHLINHGGNSINIKEEVNAFVSNVISQMTFGKCLNSECRNIISQQMNAVSARGRKFITDIFSPWWYDIFTARGSNGTFHEASLDVGNKCISLIRNEMNKQRASNNNAQNWNMFCMYLSEIEKNGQGSKYNFNETLLNRFILSPHIGGKATANVIRWCFCLLAVRPDIQSKVQNEIDQVIGSERTPVFSDKDTMPYTQSALHEMQRLYNGAGFFIPRRASKDTRIMGYDIPKNAIVITNSYAIHHDGNYWENPEDFRPERFHNPQNSNSVETPSCFRPFSYGRRKCPAETLGRTFLFLCVTSVLQKLDVRLPKGKSANSEELYSFDSLEQQELCFTRRKELYIQ